MLAFRRKENEKIYLNQDIVIEVLGIAVSNGTKTVKLGISAPEDIVISRGELHETPEIQTRRSAESDFDMRDLIVRLERKRAAGC